jgi:hypothetical protein
LSLSYGYTLLKISYRLLGPEKMTLSGCSSSMRLMKKLLLKLYLIILTSCYISVFW